VAILKTREEALELREEAVEWHLEGLWEEGLEEAEPISSRELVAVG